MCVAVGQCNRHKLLTHSCLLTKSRSIFSFKILGISQELNTLCLMRRRSINAPDKKLKQLMTINELKCGQRPPRNSLLLLNQKKYTNQSRNDEWVHWLQSTLRSVPPAERVCTQQVPLFIYTLHLI